MRGSVDDLGGFQSHTRKVRTVFDVVVGLGGLKCFCCFVWTFSFSLLVEFIIFLGVADSHLEDRGENSH